MTYRATIRRIFHIFFSVFAIFMAVSVKAQDNYEIQVYASPTMAAGRTMFETHTNFTVQGSKRSEDGVNPTNHAWHETIEITHGWNNWFETGFYFFSSGKTQFGYDWVGDHIRPRVRVPDSWNWPVGVSLSTEFGYQRAKFSPNTWTLEIRPIVDKTVGPVYLAFNPTFERALHGRDVNQGLAFAPNGKVAYQIHPKVQFGVEYYGAVGRFTNWDPFNQQEHQIVPAIDVNFGPDWEFNFGVGVGVTHNTDHLVIKMIIGRRFGKGRQKNPTP